MARCWHLLPSNSHGSTLLWSLKQRQLPRHSNLQRIWASTKLSFDQVLMKALKEDRIFLSTDGLFIDDRFVARLFNQLCYSHVKREGNTVVHSLARYTYRNFRFCCVDRGCSTTFDFLLSKLTFLVFINKSTKFVPQKKN